MELQEALVLRVLVRQELLEFKVQLALDQQAQLVLELQVQLVILGLLESKVRLDH
jgi:hypothetical protein